MSSTTNRRRPIGFVTAVAFAVLSHRHAAALNLFGRGDKATATDADTTAGEVVEYGIDVSFPIHHKEVSNNYAWLPHNTDPTNNPTPGEYKDMAIQPLGDMRKAYHDFLKGCKDHYGKKAGACDATERDRIAMNLRQPQSMQNYTDVGFKKIKAPEAVFKLLKEFWEKNHLTQKVEQWPAGNTYTNHWVTPTHMVSVEDTRLRGGGYRLKEAIWNAARDTIQEWTGEELTQCSLYGIRVYSGGAVLASHVDRLPLVSSAIINVAQDVDEPWPIEVYGHDGKATNVTMEPGDMVLYESHSVVHGRPFPLKGRHYANVFIHFEPTGHSLRHNARVESGGDVDEKYRRAAKKRRGGHEADHDGMPSYILEGTPEEAKWKREHPSRQRSARPKSFSTGSTNGAHKAAQEGDVVALNFLLEQEENLVNAKDENGWTPLHEGARGGHKEVVELLVKKGGNINERTLFGNGGTALWWAIEENGEDHPIVEFLTSLGAVNIGPDL